MVASAWWLSRVLCVVVLVVRASANEFNPSAAREGNLQCEFTLGYSDGRGRFHESPQYHVSAQNIIPTPMFNDLFPDPNGVWTCDNILSFACAGNRAGVSCGLTNFGYNNADFGQDNFLYATSSPVVSTGGPGRRRTFGDTIGHYHHEWWDNGGRRRGGSMIHSQLSCPSAQCSVPGQRECIAWCGGEAGPCDFCGSGICCTVGTPGSYGPIGHPYDGCGDPVSEYDAEHYALKAPDWAHATTDLERAYSPSHPRFQCMKPTYLNYHEDNTDWRYKGLCPNRVNKGGMTEAHLGIKWRVDACLFTPHCTASYTVNVRRCLDQTDVVCDTVIETFSTTEGHGYPVGAIVRFNGIGRNLVCKPHSCIDPCTGSSCANEPWAQWGDAECYAASVYGLKFRLRNMATDYNPGAVVFTNSGGGWPLGQEHNFVTFFVQGMASLSYWNGNDATYNHARHYYVCDYGDLAVDLAVSDGFCIKTMRHNSDGTSAYWMVSTNGCIDSYGYCSGCEYKNMPTSVVTCYHKSCGALSYTLKDVRPGFTTTDSRHVVETGTHTVALVDNIDSTYTGAVTASDLHYTCPLLTCKKVTESIIPPSFAYRLVATLMGTTSLLSPRCYRAGGFRQTRVPELVVRDSADAQWAVDALLLPIDTTAIYLPTTMQCVSSVGTTESIITDDEGLYGLTWYRPLTCVNYTTGTKKYTYKTPDGADVLPAGVSSGSSSTNTASDTKTQSSRTLWPTTPHTPAKVHCPNLEAREGGLKAVRCIHGGYLGISGSGVYHYQSESSTVYTGPSEPCPNPGAYFASIGEGKGMIYNNADATCRTITDPAGYAFMYADATTYTRNWTSSTNQYAFVPESALGSKCDGFYDPPTVYTRRFGWPTADDYDRTRYLGVPNEPAGSTGLALMIANLEPGGAYFHDTVAKRFRSVLPGNAIQARNLPDSSWRSLKVRTFTLVMSSQGHQILNARYWGSMCDAIPAEATSVRVTMGVFEDYFRPIEGSTFCDMLTSHNKHEWTPDGVNWVTPGYKNDRYGGSAKGSPFAQFEHNEEHSEWYRHFAPSWGSETESGGCCYTTKTQLNLDEWGRPFQMHYSTDIEPTSAAPAAATHFPFHVYVGYPGFATATSEPTETCIVNLMVTDGTQVLGAAYWASVCMAIPADAISVRVTMGVFEDYFRPTPNNTFCDMLTSHDKHEWTPDGVKWVTTQSLDGRYGGSGTGTPYAHFTDSEFWRHFVPSWGKETERGGCCYTTETQRDYHEWGRHFTMDYLIPCDLQHYTDRRLNPGSGYTYNKTSKVFGQFDKSQAPALVAAWENGNWKHDRSVTYYVPPIEPVSNAMPPDLVNETMKTVQCDYAYTCEREAFLFREAIDYTSESSRVGLKHHGGACESCKESHFGDKVVTHHQECAQGCTPNHWYGLDVNTGLCLCVPDDSCGKIVTGTANNPTLFENVSIYENWSYKQPMDQEAECIGNYNAARGAHGAHASDAWRHWFDEGIYDTTLSNSDPELCMGWIGVMDTITPRPNNPAVSDSCYLAYCADHDLDLSAEDCRQEWDTVGKYNETHYAAISNPWQCIMGAHPSVHRVPKTIAPGWKGILPGSTLVNAGMWLDGRPHQQEIVTVPRLVCGNNEDFNFEDHPIDCHDCIHKPTASAVFLDVSLAPTPSPTAAPTRPPTTDPGLNHQCGAYHFLAGVPESLKSPQFAGSSRQVMFGSCLSIYKANVFGENSGVSLTEAVHHWSMAGSTDANVTVLERCITMDSVDDPDWGFIRAPVEYISSGGRRSSSLAQLHRTPVQWSGTLQQFTGRTTPNGIVYRCPELTCSTLGKPKCTGSTPLLGSFCQVSPYNSQSTSSTPGPTPAPSDGGVELLDATKHTKQSSTLTESFALSSDLAINGNPSSSQCATTNPETYAWWRVDIGSLQRIRRVVVSTNNVVVQISVSSVDFDRPRTAFHTCGDETNGGEVFCDVYGRYLWVARANGWNPGTLELCDIRVYGGGADLSWLSAGVVFCGSDMEINCTSVTYTTPGPGGTLLPLDDLDVLASNTTYSDIEIHKLSSNSGGNDKLDALGDTGIVCPAVHCDTNTECAVPSVGAVRLRELDAPFTNATAIRGCNQVVCALPCKRKRVALINKHPYERLGGSSIFPDEVLIDEVPIRHTTGEVSDTVTVHHTYSRYDSSLLPRPWDEDFRCPAVECDPFTLHESDQQGNWSGCPITGKVTCSEEGGCFKEPTCKYIYCVQEAKTTPAPTPGVATQHGYTVFGEPDYWNRNWADVTIPKGFDCSNSAYFNTKSGTCVPGNSYCHPVHADGLNDILAPYTDCHDHEWIPGVSAGLTSIGTDGNVADIGEDAFNILFRSSRAQILYRDCPTCDAEHTRIYYRRFTQLPTNVSLYDKLLHNWANSTGNVHGVDFGIYSTLDDAMSNQRAWACRETTVDAGFPVGCTPPQPVPGTGDQWTPHKQGIFFVLKTMDQCAPGKACVFGNRSSPFVHPYNEGARMADRCQCETVPRELPVHILNTPAQPTRCDTGLLIKEACAEAAATIWAENTVSGMDSLRGCRPGSAECVGTMSSIVNLHSAVATPIFSTWGCNLVETGWRIGFSTPDQITSQPLAEGSVHRVCPGVQPIFYPVAPKTIVGPSLHTRARLVPPCPGALNTVNGHYGYSEIVTEEECMAAAAVSGEIVVKSPSQCAQDTELVSAAVGASATMCRDACAVSYECACFSFDNDHCRLFSGVEHGGINGYAVSLQGANFRQASEDEWARLPVGCVWVEGKSIDGYPVWDLVFNSFLNYASWNDESVSRDIENTRLNTCHVEKAVSSDALCVTSLGDEQRQGSTECRLVLDDVVPASHDVTGLAVRQQLWQYANPEGSINGDSWMQINFFGEEGETLRRVVSVTVTQIYGKTAYGERAYGNIALQSAPVWEQIGYLDAVYRDTGFSGDFYPNAHVIALESPVVTHAVRLVFREEGATYNIARIEVGGCAVDDVQLMCRRNDMAGKFEQPVWMDSASWGSSYAYGRSSSGARFGYTNATGSPLYELLDKPGVACTTGYTPIVTPTQCRDAQSKMTNVGISAETVIGENTPFDGFIHPDARTVPGCHFDNLPGAGSAWQWSSAESSADFRHQPSTDKIRFNAMTMPHRGAEDDRNKLSLIGHDWSRGRSVCAHRDYLWAEWKPLGTELWAHMPVPSTEAVMQTHAIDAVACATACQGHNGCVIHKHSHNGTCTGYDAFPPHGLVVDNTSRAARYILVSEPGWNCPGPWYVSITDRHQCEEAHLQSPTTTKINGAVVVISREWGSPSDFLKTHNASRFMPGCVMTAGAETGPVWNSKYGFDLFSRKFAFNPDFTALPLTTDNERLAPQGRAVCVHVDYLVTPPAGQAEELLASVSNDRAPITELATPEQLPDPSLQDIVVTFTLASSVVITADALIIQDELTKALAGLALAVNRATSSRRSVDGIAFVVTVDTADASLISSAVSMVLGRLTLYTMIGKINTKFAGATVQEPSPAVHSSSMISSQVEIDPHAGGTSGEIWFHVTCTCNTPDGSCGQNNMFELRTNPVDVNHELFFFGWEINSLDECTEACRQTASCAMVRFDDGPLPATATRCAYGTDFTGLGSPINNTGLRVLGIKLNRCAPVVLKNKQLCDSDGLQPTRCVDLPESTMHPLPADPQCWALVGGHTNLTTLCADGSVVEYDEATHECASIGSKRARCPKDRPYMCAFALPEEVDRMCVPSAPLCNFSGGVLPCGSTFLAASVLTLRGNTPAARGYQIYLPENDPGEREKLINSVSRCGDGFTPEGYETPELGRTDCLTGFACCQSDGDCVCPLVATTEHLQMHGGRFADTCKAPASMWPRCVDECKDLGDACKYYMVRDDTGECLLCHTGGQVAAADGWSYHVVGGTPNKNIALAKPATNTGRLAYSGYGYIMGTNDETDTTTRPNGDWYAYNRVVVLATRVSLPSVEPRLEVGVLDEHQCRSSCEADTSLDDGSLCVFWSSFDGSNADLVTEEEYCPQFAGCAIGVHVAGGVCDCRHPLLKGGVWGCWQWFIHPDSIDAGDLAATWEPARGYISGVVPRERVTPLSNLVVSTCPHGYTEVGSFLHLEQAYRHCERAAAALGSGGGVALEACNCGCSVELVGYSVSISFGNTSAPATLECENVCKRRQKVCIQQTVVDTEPTWMQCSQRCTLSVGCVSWAWNMQTKQCITFESLESLGNHGALFGSEWIGAPRAPDVIDRGEGTFSVMAAQIYLTPLVGGVLQGKHNTMEWRARRDVTAEGTPFYSSVELSPSQYFGLDSNGQLVGEFVDNPRIWELSGYPFKTGNRITKRVSLDTSCWHAEDPHFAEHPQAAVQCAVAGAAGCGPLGKTFSSALSGSWAQWHLGIWVYPMHQTDESREIVTQWEIDTLENGMPSISLDSDSNQLDLFSQSSPGLFVRTRIPFSLPRNKWTHIGLAQWDGVLFISYNLEATTSITIVGEAFGAAAWTSILQDESRRHLVGVGAGVVLFPSGVFLDPEEGMDVIRELSINSPCYGSIHTLPGGGHLFANPYHQTMEALQTRGNATFVASTADHSLTTFEWTRSDCVSSEPITKGMFYELNAIYYGKIKSSVGLFGEVAKGTYEERRLSVCTEGPYSKLCLKRAAEGGTWEVADRSSTGAYIVRYWEGGAPTNVTMEVNLYLDYTTTFPEVYRVHANNPSGMRLDSGLNDIDVALSSNGAKLFGGATMACHGGCQWFVTDSRVAFTLVRRFSTDSIGALFDGADPRGVVTVTSTTFANSTETHTWMPDGCEAFGNSSGKLVSLYTGRCLGMDGSSVTYRGCEVATPNSVCWSVTASPKPHEHHQGVTNVNTWRELEFDDSRLWWHSDVIAPPVSNDTLFLQTDGITDVEFMVALEGHLNPTNGARVTPVRAYTMTSRPIRITECHGAKLDNPLVVFACDTTCTNASTCTTHAVPSDQDGTLLCNPETCWSAPSSWSNVSHARQFDAELVETTSGFFFKRRPLNHIDTTNPRRCMSATGNTDGHSRRLQTVDCSRSDVYQAQPLGAAALLATGDDSAQNLKSLEQPGMCIGVGDSARMELVPCEDWHRLVHIRNAHRDDASFGGRGTGGHVAQNAQAVVKYGNADTSITALYYPGIGRGQLRVVISLRNNTETLDTGFDLYKAPVVSLVDDTGEITAAPNSHAYTIRVHRQDNGTHEIRRFVLIRNGTVVDERAQKHAPRVYTPQATGAWRMGIGSEIAQPIKGVVTRVDTAAYSDKGVSADAVSDVRFRFGSGRIWRLHKRGYTFDMASQLPGDCIDLCRNRTDCHAARWSPYTKTCEILPSCERIMRVAEGYPNSLNMRASPWFVFDKRADTTNQGHRIVPLHESNQSPDGSMRIDQATSEDFSAASFAHVANTALYPEGAGLIKESHFNDESVYTFQEGANYPTIISRSTEEHKDVPCTNTHTFAFVGSFESTESRFGYRRILSPASEGGQGGVSLSLSPDGHLKDRQSNVSIEVEGSGGCLSVVVIDCYAGMRVSVNGQLRHTLDKCPFDLLYTDTLAHGWIGRNDIICLGGLPLSDATHFELVAYYQALYSQSPHKLCWDPKDHTLPNKYHILPENRANLGPIHPDRWTWRVDQWGQDHTTMRCMDAAVCSPVITPSLEIYKQGLEEHAASPFHINLPDGSFINKTGEPTQVIAEAAIFVSSVSATQEREECGITAMHTEHKDAPPCRCDESFFSEWVEDMERSEQCGECVTDFQIGIYPQWLQGMEFPRKTGARVPDRNAAIKRYTRVLLDHPDAPCPDFYINPNKYLVNESWVVQCPSCARDCRLHPTAMAAASQRLQDLQPQPDTGTCPESRAQGIQCGNRTMRRSCVFHISVLEDATGGGRSCTEVALADMRQIADTNKLQQQEDSASWASVAYYADELAQPGAVVSSGYYMTQPVVNVILKQTAVFPDRNWNWVTVDAQQLVGAQGGSVSHSCPRVCDATTCSDTEDPELYSRSALYSTWNAVLVLLVVFALFISLAAAVAYAKTLRETQQKCIDYFIGNSRPNSYTKVDTD